MDENAAKIAYLQGYKKLEKRLDRKIEELARWRSKAEKMTPPLSDMPSGNGSGDGDRLAAVVERTIALATQVDKTTKDILAYQKQMLTYINTVGDDRLAEVLEYRYIAGFTWEQIAVKMQYTYRWVCKLHGLALSKLDIEVPIPPVLNYRLE